MDTLNNQLKRIASGMSRENSQTSSITDPNSGAEKPCPICGGIGFVTKNVPVDHPDFGKAFTCICQREIITARRSARLQALSNLESIADKTFETFTLDLPELSSQQLSTLRRSCEGAQLYARNPEGWLLFQGGYGSGKTHLAAAIANYRMALGDRVIFVTVPDLLDHLRATFGPLSETDYDELFEQVRDTPLLVLDDLGAESPTPWAQEKLYQLINHRYLLKLCTVITTNCDLNEIDPRIRSRLVDRTLARSLNMRLPDFRRADAASDPNRLSTLAVYWGMTFETFDLRQNSLPENERTNLRRAHEMAMDYAQNPQGGWLLFLGGHGCGKTHLAAAIANYRHARGESVILVTTPDLLDYLRAAFSPTSTMPFDKRFYEIRSADLLVIDQLDTSSATPWALEKLRQIADYRYLDRLPTVFTTTQKLEEIDPLLRSRFSDIRQCKVFFIQVPDYMGGKESGSDRRGSRLEGRRR